MGSLIAFLILYSIPCFIVAFVFGTARQLGFWWSFVACLFTTPVIGFILTLLSERNSVYNDRQKMLAIQHEQLNTLKNNAGTSTADELKKLKELLDSGAITNEEYTTAKSKLI